METTKLLSLSLAAPAAPSGFSAGAPSGFSAGDVGVISGSLSSSAIGILFLTDLDLAGRACGTRRTASSIQEFAPAMVLRRARSRGSPLAAPTGLHGFAVAPPRRLEAQMATGTRICAGTAM